MKLTYLGCMKRKDVAGGRSCCGGRSYGYSLERLTRFVMPNNEIRNFTAGETYEVTQEEGLYLLSHSCADKVIFKVVG